MNLVAYSSGLQHFTSLQRKIRVMR